MWQNDLVFPEIPNDFWLRFRERWEEPLRLLEEVISLSESFGATVRRQDSRLWTRTIGLFFEVCIRARAYMREQS